MKCLSSLLLVGWLVSVPTAVLAAPPIPAKPSGEEMPSVPAAVLAAPSVPSPTKPAGTAAPARPAKGKATDHVELDQTTITGNRELPNVMVIVPWKESSPAEFGKAGTSLLDEALAPLDREEFRRELQYDQALRAKPAAPVATAPVTPPSSP